MVDEVGACPRMSHEELDRKHVRLETIARRTCRNDVARRVRAALGERVDVIQCCVCVFEGSGAIHTATPAVAQGGELDRSFLLSGREAPDAASDAAGRTRKGNAVTVSSGHFTSLEKTTPRTRKELPVTGCRTSWSVTHGSACTCVAPCAIASHTAYADVGRWCSSASGCVGGGEVSPRRRISGMKSRNAQERR